MYMALDSRFCAFRATTPDFLWSTKNNVKKLKQPFSRDFRMMIIMILYIFLWNYLHHVLWLSFLDRFFKNSTFPLVLFTFIKQFQEASGIAWLRNTHIHTHTHTTRKVKFFWLLRFSTRDWLKNIKLKQFSGQNWFFKSYNNIVQDSETM